MGLGRTRRSGETPPEFPMAPPRGELRRESTIGGKWKDTTSWRSSGVAGRRPAPYSRGCYFTVDDTITLRRNVNFRLIGLFLRLDYMGYPLFLIFRQHRLVID